MTGKPGHEMRLIPPACVKPFVKSQKNAAADAISLLTILVGTLRHLEREIGKPDTRSARWAQENALARRLMTGPAIGPLIAMAIAVLAPPPGTFRKARDFAA